MSFRHVCFGFIFAWELVHVIAQKKTNDSCGISTEENRYPWLVGIEFDGVDMEVTVVQCTGALINRRHVVSNAQCFDVYGMPKWVLFGPNITINGRTCSSESRQEGCKDDNAHRVLIQAVIRHPRFTGDIDSSNASSYDITLIRLRDIITYTNDVRPICLPSSDVTTTEDRELHLAGIYYDVPQSYTKENLGAAMTYLSREEYQKRSYLIVARDQIFANFVKKPRIKFVCMLTGGLLVNRRQDSYELVGFLDHVSTCMSPKVFTHFYLYVDWIKSVTPDWIPCGRRRVEDVELIVNGEDTKAGDWPWHAAIFRTLKSRTNYICGGTLINKIMILTAAHCVTINGEPARPNIFTVVLGKYYLIGTSSETQEKEVDKVLAHEHFAPRNHLENDIALLKLKTEAVYTDYVQPVCIWYKEDFSRLPSKTVSGTVVGWGIDQSDALSSTLKQANLPKIPDSTCTQKNPLFYSNALNNKKFCAGWANGTSPCNGDSGGGFLVFIPDTATDSSADAMGSWYIRGVVSLTASLKNHARCDPNQYVVFTDIEKYNDWIKKHISN